MTSVKAEFGDIGDNDNIGSTGDRYVDKSNADSIIGAGSRCLSSPDSGDLSSKIPDLEDETAVDSSGKVDLDGVGAENNVEYEYIDSGSVLVESEKNELDVVETGLTSDSPNNVGPMIYNNYDNNSDSNISHEVGANYRFCSTDLDLTTASTNNSGSNKDVNNGNLAVNGGIVSGSGVHFNTGNNSVAASSGPTVPAKIFCGGLCDITTNASLRAHFSPYGEIVDSVVLTEKSTGRSRGFGFITFASEESVDAVLSSPQIVDGKEIDCKRAVPRGAIQNTDGPDDNSETVVGSGTGNANATIGSIGGGSGNARHNSGYSSGFSATKIFVGGLPQSCSDEKLREHFGKYGSIKNLSVMVDRDTNRHRGFGFVEYESPESVEEVMRHYYDHQIDNKWVECKKALPREIMAGNSNGVNNINNNNNNSLGGSNIGGNAGILGTSGGIRSRNNNGISTAASAAAAAAAAAAASSGYNSDYFRNPYITPQQIHAGALASQHIYGRYGGRHDPRYVYSGYPCTTSAMYMPGGYGQIHHPSASSTPGAGSGVSIPPIMPTMGSHYAHNAAGGDNVAVTQTNNLGDGNSSSGNNSGVCVNSGYDSNAHKDRSNGNVIGISEQNISNIGNSSVYPYNQRTAVVSGVSPQIYHHQTGAIRPGPYNSTQGRYAPSGAVPYPAVSGVVQTNGRARGMY
ncbi:ribonucleoprotein [Cryptosporidium ryanae]|uniref:ribonucleoprotein n=1 Tax=Cryptosporidium ryanae TaxID=515981 RepID=UPI00351A2383|nr:ribonucleoprotein [Cryptosporidium ryanae]